MRAFFARISSGLNWRALTVASGTGVAVAVAIWMFRLPQEQALVATLSAGVFAEIAGIWWEEHAQARQARGIPSGLLKMLDAEGYVAEVCAPLGKVRIGLEVWNARSACRDAIATGQRVVVRDIEGRTLVVEPVRR